MPNTDFSTVEEGLIMLKWKVNTRDQMGGAMYWNILNDECCDLANKLVSMGCDRAKITEVYPDGYR
jgi:hypothetical protein